MQKRGVIHSFSDRALAQLADDTMHWTALTQALRDTLPTGALAFGA